MFKLDENVYLNVLEKEREEKVELLKTKQLNEELKRKLQRLEEENHELKHKFTENELDIIDRKNNLNNLLEELQKERRANLEESQRLYICKEQIESINNFIKELKPIKEKLNFKKSVTECLHDLLVKTKLRIAESDDVLQDLHNHLTALEEDVGKTKDIHEKGVNQWQDEFLEARLQEADVILEFDKIKREIATIKHELEEKRLIREARDTVQGRAVEKFNKNSLRKKDKTYERIIADEERITTNVTELQNEIDMLNQQLKKLEDQKEDCKKKVRSNEEIKVNLHEVQRSIWWREFQTNQKINILQEKYQKLSLKISEKLNTIQSNIEEKDFAIASIEEKVKSMQKLNDSLQEDMENSMQQDPTEELEGVKENLEKEIVRLKSTGTDFL